MRGRWVREEVKGERREREGDMGVKRGRGGNVWNDEMRKGVPEKALEERIGAIADGGGEEQIR